MIALIPRRRTLIRKEIRKEIIEEAKEFDACAGTVTLAAAKTVLPCPRSQGIRRVRRDSDLGCCQDYAALSAATWEIREE